MAAPNPKLTIHDLTKIFNGLAVLRNISVDIRKGEFVSIVGHPAAARPPSCVS